MIATGTEAGASTMAGTSVTGGVAMVTGAGSGVTAGGVRWVPLRGSSFGRSGLSKGVRFGFVDIRFGKLPGSLVLGGIVAT